jgi:hypothetical protein
VTTLEQETTGSRSSEVLETTPEPEPTGPNNMVLLTGLPNTELEQEVPVELETGPANMVLETGLPNTFPQVNTPRPKKKL